MTNRSPLSTNPYSRGGESAASPHLVGREDSIASIINSFRVYAHCSIVGLPGIGKTSVARACVQQMESAAYVPMDAMRTPADVYEKILNETAAEGDESVAYHDCTDEDALQHFLNTLRRRRRQGRRCTVILDELDAIVHSHFSGGPLFIAQIREVANLQEKYGLTFGFVSRRSLDMIQGAVDLSTLSGICRIEYLKPLDKSHVEQIAQLGGVSLTADGLEALWDYTGGHPYLAELLLCEAVDQQPTSFDRAAFELAYQAQEDAFTSFYRHLEKLFTYDNLFHHFREWLARRPPRIPPPYVPSVLQAYGLVKRKSNSDDVECMSGDLYRYLGLLQQYYEENPNLSERNDPTPNLPQTPSWKVFSEQPWIFKKWPGHAQPIDKLRELLDEPTGPLPEEPPSVFLPQRMEQGVWAERSDKQDLFARACEIPGNLIALPVSALLQNEFYATNVDDALQRIEQADEYPAARLAMDVVFLRCAAAEKNLVDVPGGMIDLRLVLPERFERLLINLRRAPQRDTLADNEPKLLRLCQAIVLRWIASENVSRLEKHWLTWRLFQNVFHHIRSFDPDKRRSAITRLALQDSSETVDIEERLDPVGFGRDKFDHRLAAVLHALAFAFPETTPKARQPRRVSSRGIEESLRDLANQQPHGPNVGSVLEWNAPTNVADLALLTLLRIRPAALGELRPETRRRVFSSLPTHHDNVETFVFDFADLIVVAASSTTSKLSRAELAFLHACVQSMADSSWRRRWHWMVSTALFAAGDDSVDAAAREGLVHHSRDRYAQQMASMYFQRRAISGDASWTNIVDEVAQACAAQGGDVFVVASALGHVALHGPVPVNATAKKMLADFEPSSEDPRLRDLKTFLGVAHGVKAGA